MTTNKHPNGRPAPHHRNIKYPAATSAMLTLAIALALAIAVAFALAFALSAPISAHAARSIDPQPPPGATPVPTGNVPITTPTPRPTSTPWNQLGHNVTPRPDPTANPMIQQFIREDVERASKIDVAPTPPNAAKDKQLSAKQAADFAVTAAKASFLGMEITRLNIQKQVDSLRESVNMAIQVLDADDRYRVLLDAEDLWGDRLEEDLQFELEMYRMMDYKELTSDERRELISVRDMGYERFNLNIKRVDYNIEIVRNQVIYAAYAQYAGIAKMQAAIAITQEALDLQLKNLEILRVKYELGTATRIEVENAELSYEKAQVDMRRQKRSLTSLTTGFNRHVGENLATTYQDFDRAQLAPPRSDSPVDSYIKRALEQRSEILLAKQEMELAQRQVVLYETEITKFSTLDDKQDAAQAAEEAEIDYDAVLWDVEAEINEAYKQLVALRGVTAYYESQIETAQENYDRMQVLFEMGMTTAVSVEQVGMSLSQARMQLENNLIDIWLQRQKLDIISSIGPGGL
ncbi:MAG: TolC family protein [Oscillospiraceae bacterium]|nr:TolC family protein [Oscillospiraceae bacterium]